MIGKVFPLLRNLRLGNQNQLARTGKTPLQLPSPHPWASLKETPSPRFLSTLHPNLSPVRQTPFLHHPLHNLHQSAFLLYPTSLSQILPTTSLPSTLQPQFPTVLSTSRMETLKYCVGTRCSASTQASCHSTLPHFVACSLRPVWHRQSHPMAVLVSCPRTLLRISPLFSR